MSITITLPRTLEVGLRGVAADRHASVEKVALDILGDAIEASCAPSPKEIVAQIRAAPATKASIPRGSLADALQSASEDPAFKLEAWRREWSTVEAEMKALSRANDLAEGRG